MASEEDPQINLSAAPSQTDTVDELLARVIKAPPEFPTLPASTIVAGRYEIERVIGAGGMGTVYLAHDRSLDRPVAIKLHRSAAESSRLHREALAMAKLAHPNVVTVFEIGELSGRAFVAMEYVPGSTLRAWMSARRRSWRQIVTALLAAGEGLAAAHDAGLVHRDVKPDNIFVGDDGRVRIGDFGLAQIDGTASAPVRVPINRTTATGTVVGTPAYMAPEQIEGREVDARTDQFSFAIAAWEAVCGGRPFDGANTDELHVAIRSGVPAPPHRRAPASIRRVLTRGMASDPGARWPSMRAMLAALRSAERRPRLIAIGAGAALAIGLAITWALWPAPDPAVACADSGSEIDAILPGVLSANAAAAAARRPRPSAADDAKRILAHAERWRAAFREHARTTCTARATAALSEPQYAASRECATVRALMARELLAIAPDAATQPSDVLQIVTRMPSLTACQDPQMLSEWRFFGPDRKEASEEVIGVRARLEAARVLIQYGHRRYTRNVVEAPATAAAARGLPDLGRRLMVVRGKLAIENNELAAAERLFTDAYYESRADGDGELTLQSIAAIIDLVGGLRRDRAAAQRWMRDGLVDAKRYQASSSGAAFGVYLATATVLSEFGDHDEALRVADLADAVTNDEASKFELLPIRAAAFVGRDDKIKALETNAKVIERAREIFGARHPRVADALATRAALLIEIGKAADALAVAREAVAILDESGPDNSNSVATAALNLGVTLMQLDDPGAESQLQRARAIWIATYGEGHPDIALVDINLAPIYNDRGDTARAIELLRSATTIQERALGPEHAELAVGLYNLAVAERTAGQLEAALHTARRCLAILGKNDPGSNRHASALTLVAQILNLGAHHEDALKAATTALALRDIESVPQSAAWARLETARALIGLGRDPQRARALLVEARVRYAAERMAARLAEIDGMLAAIR